MLKFICISKLYNKIPNNVKYLAQAGGKLDNIIEKLIIFSKKKIKNFMLCTAKLKRVQEFPVLT